MLTSIIILYNYDKTCDHDILKPNFLPDIIIVEPLDNFKSYAHKFCIKLMVRRMSSA